jgi:hypothetical protein
MWRLGCCICPVCGRENYGEGRLGTSEPCACGYRHSQTELDKVRYYWILQISVCYALAALFLSFAMFYADLPADPWDRFLDPILQVPAFATFVVCHRTLVRHKRNAGGKDRLFCYYTWASVLLTVGIVASLLKAN